MATPSRIDSMKETEDRIYRRLKLFLSQAGLKRARDIYDSERPDRTAHALRGIIQNLFNETILDNSIYIQVQYTGHVAYRLLAMIPDSGQMWDGNSIFTGRVCLLANPLAANNQPECTEYLKWLAHDIRAFAQQLGKAITI